MKFSIYPLVFLFVIKIHSQNIELKEGDLVFQSIDCGPLCDAINQVTEGFGGNDFNHMGLIVFKGKKPFVLEASGTEVKLTPYDDFSEKTSLPIYVGRLKKRFIKLIPRAVSFGLKQLGTAYDDAYIYDNGKYYCSELVYDCFLYAKGEPLFELRPMTYKAPNSDVYFKVWENYFKGLNLNIPEGEPGCNPGGISLSNKIEILGAI